MKAASPLPDWRFFLTSRFRFDSTLGLDCPDLTFRSRWHAWEERVVRKRSFHDQLAYVVAGYASDMIPGRWLEVEGRLLRALTRHHLLPAAVTYAATNIGAPWPKLEKRILAGQCDPLVGVLYARDVIGGRWRKVENALLTSSAAMLMYAEEVVKGRLPASLHQVMVMRSFAHHDEHMREYMDKYGRP